MNDPSAQTALAELRSGPRVVDDALLERIAIELHESAGIPDPIALAHAAGCRVVREPSLPSAVPALLLADGLILFRPRKNTANEAIAVLHELAHWLLLQSLRPHSHADVWHLTLALAIPATALRSPFRDALPANDHVPEWAVRARFLAA